MPDVTLNETPVVSICVRYLGPTGTRGSRMRVWRSDDIYANDPDRLTVTYEAGFDARKNAGYAVRQYLQSKTEAWHGTWTVASIGSDKWVAVKTSDTLPI